MYFDAIQGIEAGVLSYQTDRAYHSTVSEFHFSLYDIEGLFRNDYVITPDCQGYHTLNRLVVLSLCIGGSLI